jgi:hypothetical protein
LSFPCHDLSSHSYYYRVELCKLSLKQIKDMHKLQLKSNERITSPEDFKNQELVTKIYELMIPKILSQKANFDLSHIFPGWEERFPVDPSISSGYNFISVKVVAVGVARKAEYGFAINQGGFEMTKDNIIVQYTNDPDLRNPVMWDRENWKQISRLWEVKDGKVTPDVLSDLSADQVLNSLNSGQDLTQDASKSENLIATEIKAKLQETFSASGQIGHRFSKTENSAVLTALNSIAFAE